MLFIIIIFKYWLCKMKIWKLKSDLENYESLAWGDNERLSGWQCRNSANIL